MKKQMMALILFLFTFVLISSGLTAEKPRIGVLRFTNNTHAGWWHGGMGGELQDLLIAELDAVVSEQKLGASGLVRKETAPEVGKLTGARYLISATVSAFEENTSGKDAGFSLMGVSVGGSKGKAYMAVDLKVMDTNTGEIADARTVEATSESTGMRLGLNLGFFSGNLGEKAKTPTGKAIRGCVVEIAQYLECSLLQGKESSCMKEYDEKESKRKQKTKDSIKLE
jgi:curli biogenesis system outer membrane secretion channel CsgG